MNEQTILDHYLICAIWASLGPDNEPLDDKYDISDFHQEALDQARADIKKFVLKANSLLEKSGLSDEQIGHDFWLTRNGHGAGFWDRELPKSIGDGLTNICKTFGEVSVSPYRKKLHFG